MTELTAKIKGMFSKSNLKSFLRLTGGENRKYDLRRSRRICLIVFSAVAAVMTMMFLSFGNAASFLPAIEGRTITSEAITAEITALQDEIASMEETDTSEYSAVEMVEYENSIENFRRSIETLRAAEAGAYDGHEISVVYINAANERVVLGTRSYSYDSVFSSFVLDFLTMLTAIFISISVATIFGAEYSDKTVKLMFTKPSSRIKLFLSKMAVVFKETIVYSVIAFAILIVMIWANTGLDFNRTLCYIGNGVRFVSGFEQVLLIFTDILFVTLFYALMAVFFCVATKSRVLPIFCVILFSRLGEIEAIANILREAAYSSMGLYNLIFINHMDLCQYIGFNQLAVGGTSFTISFFVLLAYMLAFFVSSMLSFKRQRAMK